jgi:hypothetical protein
VSDASRLAGPVAPQLPHARRRSTLNGRAHDRSTFRRLPPPPLACPAPLGTLIRRRHKSDVIDILADGAEDTLCAIDAIADVVPVTPARVPETADPALVDADAKMELGNISVCDPTLDSVRNVCCELRPYETALGSAVGR